MCQKRGFFSQDFILDKNVGRVFKKSQKKLKKVTKKFVSNPKKVRWSVCGCRGLGSRETAAQSVSASRREHPKAGRARELRNVAKRKEAAGATSVVGSAVCCLND